MLFSAAGPSGRYGHPRASGRRHDSRRGRRRPAGWLLGGVVGLGLIAALVFGLLGSLSQTSRRDRLATGRPVLDPSQRLAPAAATPPARPAPIPLPTAAAVTQPPGGATPPAAVQLGLTMSRALRAAGPQAGALVYDLDDHSVLYANHPLVGRPPASVEKLYTTVALMLRLGPRARLSTELLGSGHLAGGVWHGNLYLRGGGDPTFGDQAFNAYWNHGFGPTPNQIAGQLAAAGIHRVTGSLYADESLFDRRRGGLLTHLDADVGDFGGQLSALVYDHGTTLASYTPATFAVHEVALTLRAAHIEVRAAPSSATAPAGARVLATVLSPPLSVMARLMDVPSDDLFAELLTKQLGVRFGHGGSIAAGAAVIERTIASNYGIHPRILDGSGLSRSDASSPLDIVQLLHAVWRTPVGRQLAAALPTVGREGTVAGIGLKTPAAGHCIAKTGTLNGVTNLAGYCTARDGHTLAFALEIDGPSNGLGFLIEDRLIGAVAGYDGR